MNNTAEILEPSFKDGDDGDGSSLEGFVITVASNGFILTITDDEGDIVEVHPDIDAVFESIRRYL